MTWSLTIEPEAEADLVRAKAWYDDQTPGWGSVFLDQAEKTFALIVSQPRLFPVVRRRTRIVTVDRFSYGILYRIDGDRINVLAVYHLRSDLKSWQERL